MRCRNAVVVDEIAEDPTRYLVLGRTPRADYSN